MPEQYSGASSGWNRGEMARPLPRAPWQGGGASPIPREQYAEPSMRRETPFGSNKLQELIARRRMATLPQPVQPRRFGSGIGIDYPAGANPAMPIPGVSSPVNNARMTSEQALANALAQQKWSEMQAQANQFSGRFSDAVPSGFNRQPMAWPSTPRIPQPMTRAEFERDYASPTADELAGFRAGTLGSQSWTPSAPVMQRYQAASPMRLPVQQWERRPSFPDLSALLSRRRTGQSPYMPGFVNPRDPQRS